MAATVSIAGPAAPATAGPGGLRVLVVEAMCNPAAPPATLVDQIRGAAGTNATVDVLNGAAGTVDAAQLHSYDAVVAIGDCGWLDPAAMGDELADFQDGGGVVVGAGSDWRAGSGAALSGRWISAGYSPYRTGSSPALGYDVVGWQDVGNPLLSGIPAFQDDEGVGPLAAYYRDAVSLTAGAAELARWTDGNPAVAVKGRAVGVNAYLGDHYGLSAWSGSFGALVVNAAELLGPHTGGGSRSPCVVPRLKGLRLAAARRRLRRAHCRLGRTRGSGGTVVSQKPKPGSVRAPGRRVDLRLG